MGHNGILTINEFKLYSLLPAIKITNSTNHIKKHFFEMTHQGNNYNTLNITNDNFDYINPKNLQLYIKNVVFIYMYIPCLET